MHDVDRAAVYENGFITYMRTDSTEPVADGASPRPAHRPASFTATLTSPARAPRAYSRKVKNAQEAHEAIRPSGDVFRTPGQVAGKISGDEFRLYELIWQRTIASQMVNAVGTTISVRIAGESVAEERASSAPAAAPSPSRVSCARTSKTPTTTRTAKVRTTPRSVCRNSPPVTR